MRRRALGVLASNVSTLLVTGHASAQQRGSVVHLEAAAEYVLESRATDRAPWSRLCSAPCDIALPLAGRYRVVDATGRSSNEFGIDEGATERVVVRVKEGSGAATAGGVTLIGVGSVVALAGMVTAAASFGSELGGPGGAPNGGLLAAGVLVTALGVGGIVWRGRARAVRRASRGGRRARAAAGPAPRSLALRRAARRRLVLTSRRTACSRARDDQPLGQRRLDRRARAPARARGCGIVPPSPTHLAGSWRHFPATGRMRPFSLYASR